VKEEGERIVGNAMRLAFSFILAVTLSVVALPQMLLPGPEPTEEGEWHIETVDGIGYVGSGTSISLDSNDRPHISYHDLSNSQLKYANRTGGFWLHVSIGKAGGPGLHTSIALDSGDRPHMSYQYYPSYDVRYASYTGSSWLIETADWAYDIGGYTSIALDNSDRPHISYHESANGWLKYAKRNESVWNTEIADSTQSAGDYSSIALDGNDYPHISYYNADPYNELKYARWDGSAWNIEVVDSGNRVGKFTSIALDGDDFPHITYLDSTNGDLKYARWDGSAWNIETVDSDGDVGWFSSIDLDNQDKPHISYFDWTNSNLKYATKANLTANEPPLANAGDDSEAEEGAETTFDGSGSIDPEGDDLSFEWDFDASVDSDGDGNYSNDVDGNGSTPVHVYGDDGVYTVTLKVTDIAGLWDMDICIVTVLNVPPTAVAGGAKEGFEVSTFTFDGGFTDPGIYDTHTFEWDFDYHGITFDVDATGQSVTHTWIDDFDGYVALRVTDDDGGEGIDIAHVLVKNVPPTVELKVLPIEVDVSLRIAGEKWHDVSIELYEDGVLVAEGSLTRYPGSPNDQMLDLTHIDVDISRQYSAIVRYTPEDDPVNGQPSGANPCWVILRFNDGEEVWLHHTFNVQHPETYIWEVDLTAGILSHGLTFEATAYDPGADDLTFHWDFGDGTVITNFYPSLNNTYPVRITETITHVFLGRGTYTITITVEDDDAAILIATVVIVIP
jgi:hypothetical protein